MVTAGEKFEPVSPSPSTAAVGNTVVIQVGPDKKSYTLHEELLKFYSGSFRRALLGDYTGTGHRTIPLNGVDIGVFDAFVDWLYAERLPRDVYMRGPSQEASTILEGSTNTETSIPVMWRLYTLAHHLEAKKLKHVILDIAFTHYAEADNTPTIPLVAYLSNQLPGEDVMLRLLGDVLCVNDGIRAWRGAPQGQLENVPKAFFVRALFKVNSFKDAVEDNEEAALQREDYGLAS
ncbi:hypothetical protein T440DRAFT_510947 [Plenodomus tracheiphilus IPT5]|uniref:BTB domain-containing protein n=1 Tax=Plenodomus tracheiphilus IPT5 TaxID=1408161 RepID=A0A6A7AT97_9PLEO|nr:hypothetical protein T440DRAFT_510947 [Plenodomus tracheiphilus IPT5]